ncbi:MAG: SGNH/GDSL hydrolase family protein [Candidatus Neomarinimicrobiota bacterium]
MIQHSQGPIALVALLLGSACSGPAIELPLGEHIIFLGNSITELGDQPGGFVAQVRDTLSARRPDGGIEVVGAGISGNKVPDLQERLNRDVLSRRPNLVFVLIGINDVWQSTMVQGGTPIDRYEEGLRGIVRRINNMGAAVVLCTPAVIGERLDGGNPLDAMLDEYAAVTRRVARDGRIALVDLRKIFLKHLRAHNPDNRESGILTTDGVHLNDRGNRLLAETVLRNLGE